MPFPALKLVSVLARQLSRPLSKYLQRRAESSQSFRTMCVSFGGKYHHFEQTTLKRFYERDSPRKAERRPTYIPQLNEEKAVELGTTLLGEFVVFGVAAFALLYEYRRGVLKERQKDHQLDRTLQHLETQLQALEAGHEMLMLRLLPTETSQTRKTFERTEDVSKVVSSEGGEKISGAAAAEQAECPEEDLSGAGIVRAPAELLDNWRLPTGVKVSTLRGRDTARDGLSLRQLQSSQQQLPMSRSSDATQAEGSANTDP